MEWERYWMNVTDELVKIASAEISQTAITECVAAAKKEKQKIKREKIQKFGI